MICLELVSVADQIDRPEIGVRAQAAEEKVYDVAAVDVHAVRKSVVMIGASVGPACKLVVTAGV